VNFDEVSVIRKNDPSTFSTSDYLEESFYDFDESELSLVDSNPDLPLQPEPMMATVTPSIREGSRQHPYSENEENHLLLQPKYQFHNQSRESLDSGYWSVNSTRGITVDIASINRTDHKHNESDTESQSISSFEDDGEQLDITRSESWPVPPTWL